MTAPAETAVCGERNPARPGATCTRAQGHAGGHLDEPRDVYWQAGEGDQP